MVWGRLFLKKAAALHGWYARYKPLAAICKEDRQSEKQARSFGKAIAENP
jgi:hypothetical protein